MTFMNQVFVDQLGRFVDQFGVLFPEGTVLEVVSLERHQGVVAYTAMAQQVIIHNSKKLGRAVISWPNDLSDGKHEVIVNRTPLSPSEGGRIVQSANADVQRGVRWTPFDNCQDLVSRATTGKNGSPTRNILLGGALVLGILFFGFGE